jgi:hypothetical protein
MILTAGFQLSSTWRLGGLGLTVTNIIAPSNFKFKFTRHGRPP